MNQKTIHIKNMVCPRCIRVVEEELVKAGFNVIEVTLGEAIIAGSDGQNLRLAEILKANGFELLEEKSARLVKDIKTFIIDFIRSGKLRDNKIKVSVLLENKLHKDINYISHLFSQSENLTLEKFTIAQKIELVKEWLAYNQMTLSEMADALGYSSVAHLSSQFKQVTGFSTSEFKKLKGHRKSIDAL